MIKIFEIFNSEFNNGDYVLISKKTIEMYKSYNLSPYAKIDKLGNHSLVDLIAIYNYPPNSETRVCGYFVLSISDLERKLSWDEIEQYELEKSMLKYNL